ncbi:MAG TPA: NADH-quinone oxidoreductase subunit N [Candidatus Eisenbacteria bacterium]|nr:NADH-quinone oxidoreductase subunit N [Candidatus Eisenbacteria bacterium]
MDVNFVALLPSIQVTVAALAVLLLDTFFKDDEKPLLAWVSLLGVALGIAGAAMLWGSQETAFGGTFLLDNFALFFIQLVLIVAALTIVSSISYVRQTGIYQGEWYALILFATAGSILMVCANDLIVFFLGLETMSISVYVLSGMWRASSRASEAAMKYFVIGAFATGFLLYGIALLYGATGSTALREIAAHLVETQADWPLFLAGGGLLLLIGFAFKVGAVPFHFWIPDVYEGAPTPVTGFMAVAVKAAAFAAWARVLMHELSPLDSEWASPVKLIAILTMTVGNFLAISQTSVKRMLAYSSIAHAGYALVAVVAGEEWGGPALLFYLLAYAPMTFGAFAVVTALSDGPRMREGYGDFAGLALKHPFVALSMAVFMLSLAGFPPLGGFTGKFYVFRAAVNSGHTDLAVIGVLNSLVSVVYYLRVIVKMYMEPGAASAQSFGKAPGLYLAIAAAVITSFYLGILPMQALDWSRNAFLSLY